MKNKLIFKIFRTSKPLRLLGIQEVRIDLITQSCFEFVIEFEKLSDAITWREENQKLDNEYVIIPCY